jgi:hypothetical protein
MTFYSWCNAIVSIGGTLLVFSLSFMAVMPRSKVERKKAEASTAFGIQGGWLAWRHRRFLFGMFWTGLVLFLVGGVPFAIMTTRGVRG